MEMKNAKKATLEDVLKKLSAEERAVIESVKKSTAAKAKKENTKRMLDDKDRVRIRMCLTEAGCDDKPALNNMRILALRWVLDNHANEFVQYVKDLHGEAKKSQDRPSRLATPPRQQVQHGSYPAERGK